MDSEKAEEEGEESGVLAGLRVEDRKSFSCSSSTTASSFFADLSCREAT